MTYNTLMDSRKLVLDLEDSDKIEQIADVLSSKARVNILRILAERSRSIGELGEILNLAPSTMSFHIKALNDAGIINIIPSPSKKGNEKNISIRLESVKFRICKSNKDTLSEYIEDIPIGGYSKFNITPPCLIATADDYAGPLDDPDVFFAPAHANASLISFTLGHLEYSLPINNFEGRKIASFSLSMELCSECPGYKNEWKSDISFWIGDTLIGQYRSLGDFGGRKGRFSPAYWPKFSSNYGVLVRIQINKTGTYVNDVKKSDYNIFDLTNSYPNIVPFRVGVDKNSRYHGGINLFGKGFGDYDQGIVETIEFEND